TGTGRDSTDGENQAAKKSAPKPQGFCIYGPCARSCYHRGTPIAMSPRMTKKYESRSEFARVRVSSPDRMGAMMKRISLVITALVLNSMSVFGVDTPPSLTLSPVSQI